MGPYVHGLHDLVVLAAPSQESAMDLGVQGLDPAIHDLRETRVGGDIHRRHAALLQQLKSAAGGKDLKAQATQPPTEFQDAGLVRDADQGASCRHHVTAHGYLRNSIAARVGGRARFSGSTCIFSGG